MVKSIVSNYKKILFAVGLVAAGYAGARVKDVVAKKLAEKKENNENK